MLNSPNWEVHMLKHYVANLPVSTTREADPSDPYRVMVSASVIRSIAATAVAASTEDVTPTITGVLIHVDPAAKSIEAVATDRYRVAWFEAHDVDFATGEAADPYSFLVPAKWLTTVARAVTAKRHPLTDDAPAIVIEWTGASVRISDAILGFSLSTDVIRGNYPPVTPLFPDVETMKPFDGAIRLKSAFLADVAKLKVPGMDREGTVVLHTQSGDEYSPAKPRPVLFELTGVNSSVRYMVQPNILLSSR